MTDNQFDKYVNDKLSDYAAPVPAGLWEKVAEGQFDQFVGQQLKDVTVPVPDGVFDKILDARFDQYIGASLHNTETPVPTDMWDRVQDGQFDRFVGDSVQDYEVPVPEGLWEKIKPAEDDDRPFAWLWLRYPAAAIFILLTLLGGAVGTYYYLQYRHPGVEQKAAVNTKKTNPANHSTETPSVNDDNNKDAEGVLPEQVPDNAAAPVPANGTRQPLPYASAPNTTHLKKQTKAEKSVVVIAPETLPVLAQQLPVHAGGDSRVNETPASLPGTSNDLPDLYYPEHIMLPGNTLPIERVHTGYSLDLHDVAALNPHHASSLNNVIICPTDRKYHNTDWYLETYVSPDLSFKSVSNVSASQQYLARKDSSESQRIGFTAGVRLVKPLTDNILLKTGLQYSQINQKYVYRTENEVKTTTVVTVRTIIRAPGDTVIVKDTSVLQTIGYRNNIVSNHFKSFDIPITIGYQFGNDDLKFGINAGVLFNISSWYQGVILDTSLATVTLNKTGNMQYKTKLGLGLYGGISVVKTLGDDLSLFFEPYFRYNLSNMTTDQAPYRQKFSLGGLSIGLRWNLNRQ